MSWSAPSPADVLSEFTPTEKGTIAQATGADNGAAILGRVVAEIRDSIRSGGYDLDPDDATIPLGLHGAAIDLTRWRLLISVPAVKQLQTDARKEAAERAEKKLAAIAAATFAPEPPTAGTTSRGGNWGSENKLVPRLHPLPRPGQQSSVDSTGYANPAEPADTP